MNLRCTCPYCGRTYTPHQRRQKTCRHEECRKARAKELYLARKAAGAGKERKRVEKPWPEAPGERERLEAERISRRREKQREYRRRWNRKTWPERRDAANAKKRENRRAGRFYYKLRGTV